MTDSLISIKWFSSMLNQNKAERQEEEEEEEDLDKRKLPFSGTKFRKRFFL